MAVRTKITRHEEFRRRGGYSVTGLATVLGFSHAYVSRIEAGDMRPSERYRRAFCRLLKVPEQLVFDEGV